MRRLDAKSAEEMDRLEGDHCEANSLHNSVEQLYSKWIESSGLSAADYRQLCYETELLKQLYSAHIDMEEKFVFARASQILDMESIAAIGTEFRLRRK